MNQRDVDQYVDNHLDVSVFAQQNKCQDIMCVFQKLMTHKVFRNWNQWQSLLLHRYFWNMQLGGVKKANVNIYHVQLKNFLTSRGDGNDNWVFSRGEMRPDKWHIQDVDLRKDLFSTKTRERNAPTTVMVVEMWQEVKPTGKRRRCAREPGGEHNSAAWFHNLVLVHQQNKIVCIPFHKQALEWAETLPLEKLLPNQRGAPTTKFVHRPDYPFLPLLWFHVAMQTGKQNQLMTSLTQDIHDVGGTAFFELHLVDALVRPSETMESLLQFSEERVSFAHEHMQRYQPLIPKSAKASE